MWSEYYCNYNAMNDNDIILPITFIAVKTNDF